MSSSERGPVWVTRLAGRGCAHPYPHIPPSVPCFLLLGFQEPSKGNQGMMGAMGVVGLQGPWWLKATTTPTFPFATARSLHSLARFAMLTAHSSPTQHQIMAESIEQPMKKAYNIHRSLVRFVWLKGRLSDERFSLIVFSFHGLFFNV